MQTSPPKKKSEIAELSQQLHEFILQDPNIFGGADIYNIRYQNKLTLAGIMTAVLTGLVDTNHQPAVHKFVVVVSPGLDAEECEEKFWEAMTTTFHLFAQREMGPSEKAWLRKRFRLIVASDQRTSAVLDIIRIQPKQTSIIVTDAAAYRDNYTKPHIAYGALSPFLPEDIWVPQLHSLATAAVDLAQKRLLYVALDTYQFSPNRAILSNLLQSIDGCGVMGSTREDSPDSILAARAVQWDAWIREGRIGQVFRDIEQLPATLDSNKPFLRIQMLHKSGQFPDALHAIRKEIASGQELDSSMRVKLARIAQDANASTYAAEILSPAIPEINSREDLESALLTAQDAGLTELENMVAGRLGELFPGSPGIRQRLLHTLLTNRDYAEAAAMAAKESDSRTEFYSNLAQFLSGDDRPNYKGLIDFAGSDISQADAYRIACADDALARKLIPQALDLIIPLPNTPAQAERGEMLLLQILKQVLLLNSQDGQPYESFQPAFVSLIERLAANPKNQALRGGLVHLIQPSIAGTMGLALIACIVLNLASRPVRLEKQHLPEEADMNWLLERKPFLNAAFGWLESEAPVVIGRATLPETLLTEPADLVVSSIIDCLTCAPLESDEDVSVHMKYLALVTSVIPHSSDTDFDLRLMRLVAGRLASSGRTQIARDLAEQTLLNSTATPRRRRLGWFAMADIYHRCHNHLEAFLAIACTFAANDESDENQVWHEITGMARLFRDCGLHKFARTAIQQARKIFQNSGISAPYSYRLDTIALQIRQNELLNVGSQKADIEALLADIVQNSVTVLKHHDMTEPTAIMLGQVLYHAREIGATIPTEADNVLAELLNRAKGSHCSLIRTMTEAAPSADGLLPLLNISAFTRYSDDIGYDMINTAIVARRIIATGEFINDSTNTAFALEILADRGVAMPGWDEAPEPAPSLKNIDEAAEIARLISREGISVVQAGFDSSGHLVRVSTVDGHMEAPVREADDIMLAERFNHWSKKYPYAYGIDGGEINLFYTTTANLRLTNLPQGPIVFVADVRFQSFPPNILYVDEEFAGRTRAMASAPSLVWLQAAFSRGMIGDGRFCAWISTSAGVTERQTLSMIAQRLESTFSQYGFQVDNSPRLPVSIAGASMAVIAAHGGIHPEGSYFQVVSDEDILKASARDLANALRNVGIVILFVCSGGRSDKHPGANTTVGLAKEILDRGCAAVIASPWPLDARVPSHWLPVFLKKWSQGHTLIEANFCANKEVDRMFSQDPARGLAMTIFGNPTLRRI